MTINRFRTSPRRILGLAALALVLHGLMPLWMLLPALSGQAVELCSGTQIRTVYLPPDASGQHSPAPASDMPPQCPLCMAGSHFAVTTALGVPPTLRGDLHDEPAVQRPASVQPALYWPHYRSRAPPVFSA